MPRPRRKKIKFTEESLNELLQEVYNDSHNIKAKIARLFNKWEQRVKDGGDIVALGDSIIKLINAEAKNQDQKIMLIKYLKEVVFENKNNEGKTTKEEGTIDNEEKTALLRMVKDSLKEKGDETKTK